MSLAHRELLSHKWHVSFWHGDGHFFKDMVEKIHGIVISISLSHDFGKKENHQVKLLRLVFWKQNP